MAATPSGKDKILKYTELYVGGFDLTGDYIAIERLGSEYPAIEMSGAGQEVISYQPGRRTDVGIYGVQVFMNDTASTGAFTLLKDVPNTSQVSVLFGGGGAPAEGDPAYLLGSVQMMDAISFDAGRAVLTADFLPDAAQMDALNDNPIATVISGTTSRTATVSTTSSDYESQTTSGFQALIHITATSSGNFACVIEDSANDSSWATLGTFTTTGGSLASERLSATGTVDRYVRMTFTRTAGTMTAVVTFARMR